MLCTSFSVLTYISTVLLPNFISEFIIVKHMSSKWQHHPPVSPGGKPGQLARSRLTEMVARLALTMTHSQIALVVMSVIATSTLRA